MLQNDTDTIAGIDVEKVREDFPLLTRKVFGKPLVYFDNAATSQKPVAVLNALEEYYRKYNSNVHRGVHSLSQEATDAYEGARKKVAEYINAKHDYEIIFTRGTTEGINLVAATFARKFLKEGDVVLITAMEHHSNIVPWQLVCEERGAKLDVIAMNEHGELLLEDLDKKLTDKVKFVSVSYVSNSLGTINPVEEVIAKAHAKNIPVMLDAAQAIVHLPIDVQKLDAEFVAFSGHKLYGPTGIGVLYGRAELLAAMPPFMTGGDVAHDVDFDEVIWEDAPLKFEAGTPAFVEAIGLGAAVDYLQTIGMDAVRAHERELTAYALERLGELPGLRIYGPTDPDLRGGVVTFTVDGIEPQGLALALDQRGVAIRSGRHCAHPLHRRLGVGATARASFAIYNDFADVDALCDGIAAIQRHPPHSRAARHSGDTGRYDDCGAS